MAKIKPLGPGGGGIKAEGIKGGRRGEGGRVYEGRRVKERGI